METPRNYPNHYSFASEKYSQEYNQTEKNNEIIQETTEMSIEEWDKMKSSIRTLSLDRLTDIQKLVTERFDEIKKQEEEKKVFLKKRSLEESPTSSVKKPPIKKARMSFEERKKHNNDSKLSLLKEYQDKAGTLLQEVKDKKFIKNLNGENIVYLKANKLKKVLSGLLDNHKLSEKEAIEILAAKISTLVEQHKVRFPFTQISEEEAQKDFLALNTQINKPDFRNTLIKHITWSAKNPFPNGFIENGNNFPNIMFSENGAALIGRRTSNYFMQPLRMRTSARGKPNPLQRWESPVMRQKVFKKAIQNALSSTNNHNSITMSSILASIKSETVVSCQFRPVTLSLCLDLLTDRFNLNSKKTWKVFDPCGGWGDRLIGALADKRVTHYTYVDANENLIGPAKEIVSKFNPNNTKVLLIGKPIEKIQEEDLISDGFDPDTKSDIVFTSPPYYVVHDYEGKEQASQYVIYKNQTRNQMDIEKSFKSWIEKFFYPLFDQCDKQLVEGGFMVINIDDVSDHNATNSLKNKIKKGDKTSVQELFAKMRNEKLFRLIEANETNKTHRVLFALCQSMDQFLMRKGYQKVGCVGYGLKTKQKRNSKINDAEPMFIYRKPCSTYI